MNLAITILLFAVGIVFIVKGGDYFVDASSWIAEVSGIPKLIVGATIVSIATTLPELIVSVFAAMDGKVDMSIGNAIGSVTANVGLIMAISIICIPAVIKRADYIVKSVLLIVAAGLIVACGLTGEVGIVISIMLLIVFVIFAWENISAAKKAMLDPSNPPELRPTANKHDVIVNLVKFVVGVIGIVWGADLLVDNGSLIAAYMGISERVIGVTVIAVGTSLPELITTITAIVKKESSLSVGNILGANIIDLTLIMPLCSVISGKALPVASSSAMIDLPACLLVCSVAIIPAMISEKFRRSQGILLLLIYAGYLYLTCTMIMG